MDGVAVRVLEFLGGLSRAEGKAFREDDLLAAVDAGTNDEKDRGGLDGFVNETAANADGQLGDGSLGVTGRFAVEIAEGDSFDFVE